MPDRRYALLKHTHDGLGSGAAVDHGALLGLADNDHPQYSLLAGAETHTAGKGTAEVEITSASGVASLDPDDSNAFYLELTENVTLTIGDGRTGQVISIVVKQNSSGGWTLTLAGNVLEAGAISPDPSAYSHISARWVAAGTWLAVATYGFA